MEYSSCNRLATNHMKEKEDTLQIFNIYMWCATLLYSLKPSLEQSNYMT